MEEWDLSMQLFDAVVQSPVQSWVSTQARNIGTNPDRREEVLQWAHQSGALRDILASDLALYEHALELFKRQTAVHLGRQW